MPIGVQPGSISGLATILIEAANTARPNCELSVFRSIDITDKLNVGAIFDW